MYRIFSTLMSGNLWNMRRDYTPSLPFIDLSKKQNPFEIFTDWFNEAKKNDDSFEPNTMVLSTIDSDGYPSSRCVLLKYYDENGFQFFTNYESQKAKDMEVNNRVSLLFHWPKLDRIRGNPTKIDENASEKYFHSRPIKSQISAFLSHQSKEITDEDFEKLKKQAEELYTKITESDYKIPFPFYWGGYNVKPIDFEFWQGDRNRFHNRYYYKLNNFQEWFATRLQP